MAHLIEVRVRDALKGMAVAADVQAALDRVFHDAHAGKLIVGEKDDIS